MSYQVLARKYRPHSFADMVGQTHVLRALQHALAENRLHHAYLFSGTRGVGKTTVARILAKALNCERGVSAAPCGECSACREIDQGSHVDLIEVDAASRTKVEETRELLENVQYSPAGGRFKIYLIDEVHMFSNHSFNALLKTLEEPPPHVKFLFATTEPQKLPITVLSRCLHFNLKRLSAAQIAAQLEKILAQESLAGDARAVGLIAAAADGSMRDALSLLDQAVSYCGGTLQGAEVGDMLGTIDPAQSIELLNRLAAGDAKGLFDQLAMTAELAPDYQEMLADLLSLLQQIALLQLVPDYALPGDADPAALRALAAAMTPEQCQLFYQIALIGRRDLPLARDTRSGFEMVLLRMLAFNVHGGEETLVPPRREAAPAGPQTQPPTRVTEDNGGQWKALVESLPVSGLVKELASNCVLEERTDQEIRLKLPRDYLRNQAIESRLEAAIREHLGAGMRVYIASGDLQGRETPNVMQQKEDDEQRRIARESIESDPNVQQLVREFDAELEPNSVRRLPQ